MSQLARFPFGPRDDVQVPPDELSPQEGPDVASHGDPPLFGPPFVRFVVDEFARQRERLERLVARLEPRDRAWAKEATGNLDANGTGTVYLLEVPEGFELFLHRVYVTAGPAVFSSRITGGNVSVQIDAAEEDGADLTTVGLPIVLSWSSSAAPVAQPGQRVSIVVTTAGATAHSTKCTVRARGRLVRSRLSVDEP